MKAVVKLGRALSHGGRLRPRHRNQVVVFVVIADVEAHAIQGAVVRIGLLLVFEDVVLLQPARSERMQPDGDYRRGHEVFQRLDTQQPDEHAERQSLQAMLVAAQTSRKATVFNRSGRMVPWSMPSALIHKVFKITEPRRRALRSGRGCPRRVPRLPCIGDATDGIAERALPQETPAECWRRAP